jgi:hypothetical protein
MFIPGPQRSASHASA